MSDWIPTTCMRCAVGCGHLQRGADIGNGIDTVRGDAAHPVNQGLACQRGIEESQDPDGEWLSRPMVRRDGELVSTTWDVALAEALQAFRDANEDGEVAVLGSGQQTNEAAYALGKLARGGFGTPYYDANTTLCMASAVTAYYQAFGSDAPPCTYEDIEDAEAHVIWGANPSTAHPVMFRWIQRAANSKNANIIVVDPVATGTVKDADDHVAVEPGQDIALARAVLARLVETDRIDEAFIAEATDGFERLRESLPNSDTAATDTGVSSRSAGGDTMRNISGCPVAGKAEEYVESRELLDEIQDDIREDDELCNMPRKFNISVTGCRQGCAQDSINDIGLEPAHTIIDGDEVEGFNVRVGGGTGGREPRRARPLDLFVRPEHAKETVRAFVELYHEEGNRQNRSKNRARFFVDDWGVEKVREAMDERLDFEPERAGTDFRGEYTYNAGKPSERGAHDHVGAYDQKGDRQYVGLSVPVGRMPAADVIEMADLASEYGSGEIRLSRRQNPLIMDIPETAVDGLLGESLLEKYSPEPNPFVQGAMACTGTEFCSLALTETKARMAVLLRWLGDNVDVPDDVDRIKIHFSGCTADCGQAMTADIGLQGMRARKDGEMVEAIDVGVGGGIGEEPTFIEWIRQRVPADELPGLLESLIEAYAALREEGQTFREWVDATGHETIVELAEPGEVVGYEDPCLYDAKGSWYPFDEGESPAPTAPDGTPLSADD